MTIASPTTAILEAKTMESPDHIRLKIPGFAPTVMGVVACSAVAIVAPLPHKQRHPNSIG